MPEKKNKTIIFDFDGVIADSFDLTVDILKKLAKLSPRAQERELSRKDNAYFRKFSSEELLLRLPKWKIFIIVIYAREKLAGMIRAIKPVPEMKNVLEKMKAEGYTLGIVSSNDVGTIRKFIAHNKMEFFDFICSSSVFLRKEKRLAKVLRSRNLKNGDVVFVGDETRDVAAAGKAGIRIIAVGWGFTEEEVLRRSSPDFLVGSPEELLDVIKTIL